MKREGEHHQVRNFHLNDIAIYRDIPEAALTVHMKPGLPEYVRRTIQGMNTWFPEPRSTPIGEGRAGDSIPPGKPAPH